MIYNVSYCTRAICSVKMYIPYIHTLHIVFIWADIMLYTLHLKYLRAYYPYHLDYDIFDMWCFGSNLILCIIYFDFLGIIHNVLVPKTVCRIFCFPDMALMHTIDLFCT